MNDWGIFSLRVEMTHTERYCWKFLNRGKEEVEKEWGSWLRAQPRRTASQAKSKWLWEDDDVALGERYFKISDECRE